MTTTTTTQTTTTAGRARKRGRGKDDLTEISWAWNTAFLGVLLIGVLLVALPLALIVIISFSSARSIAERGYTFFPAEFSLEAYRYVFETGDALLNSYLITIFYTLAGTLLSLAVMALYSYVIAQRGFALRRFFTWALFFTMLFSGGLVPSYILNVRYLHINDRIWIFLLPTLMNGFNVIVLRTFIRTTIPEAIIESARIDGAGHFTIFARIVLPLFKAGLATIGLFQVVSRWNNWFTGFLYINKPRLIPLQTMLMKIQNQLDFVKQNTELAASPDGLAMLGNLPTEGMRMAITLLVIIPVLFAYPFFQRYFVKGLTVGGIKE